MIVSKTQRLILREASVDDSRFMLKLVNEPAWHEFIYSHSINTIEKASEFIEQKMIAIYQNEGFGLWVLEKIDDGVPIGICGLLKRDSLPCLDIGFALLSSYWGQGFALEASSCSLRYARNKLKMKKILAISSPSNTRSLKLLKKLGFVYESRFSHPGSDEVLSLYSKTQ